MDWYVLSLFMASGCGRCWVVYNEALVMRVMLLFSFHCLDCWGEEVGSVNVGRVGDPFKYPHSFIANLKDTRAFLWMWL